MKFILFLALIGITVAIDVSQYAKTLGFATFDHQFNSFKINHNKKYETSAEEEYRKLVFLDNLKTIESHNELYRKGEKSYELGVNQFADLTLEEYQKMFRMPNPLANVSSQSVDAFVPEPESLANLPTSLDWNAQGKVSHVKNQGGCGSCWSFSVTGAIESLVAIKHNQMTELSEEQLVDCMNTNCAGQWIYDAFKYVINNGIETEAAYPYTAGSGHSGQCRNDPSKQHTRISSYKALGRGISDTHPLATDDEIMAAVQQQPVSMMFNANGDAFRFYKSGVLTENDMGWAGSHAVLIVGWGNEGGHNYWLIKNSWGNTWGIQGYFKMVRGQNLRHVNEYLYFPVL